MLFIIQPLFDGSLDIVGDVHGEIEALRSLMQHLGYDDDGNHPERLDVSVSYISKVENEKLHFGDYPSAKFIHKLADELDADEDELLLLADKVPEELRKRIREKPEAFRVVASLDDASLDKLVDRIGQQPRKRKSR